MLWKLWIYADCRRKCLNLPWLVLNSCIHSGSHGCPFRVIGWILGSVWMAKRFNGMQFWIWSSNQVTSSLSILVIIAAVFTALLISCLSLSMADTMDCYRLWSQVIVVTIFPSSCSGMIFNFSSIGIAFVFFIFLSIGITFLFTSGANDVDGHFVDTMMMMNEDTGWLNRVHGCVCLH